MTAVALIPVDLHRTRLGLRSRVGDVVAGRAVLAHTVDRVSRCRHVGRIVLVHPQGQDPMPLVGKTTRKPVTGFAVPSLRDRYTQRWASARKWALTCWRGGLGNAMPYDELLPAEPLAAALRGSGGGSALLVGGDWCLVDPTLCDAALELHLGQPESLKIAFTQAPPGLCGLAVHGSVLEQLAEKHASFGSIFGYNPRAPVMDPLGREACAAIPPSVRDASARFICDTPRTAAATRAILERVGDDTSATRAVEAYGEIEASLRTGMLPQQVTIELTPRRPVSGPITPQHHVPIDRPDIDPEVAAHIFAQLGEDEDAAVLLGGLGDALLHPRWRQIADAAKAAGVLGVGIETDLLCEQDDLEQLLDAPIDVISVRLNADTPAVYERVMGVDGFKRVIGNLEWLINTRNRRSNQSVEFDAGVPWIVPRMVKTAETLPDLERFFDRWMVFLGHAVIEPAQCGCGLMPAQSPVPMAPPRRQACRQISRRITILSDGKISLCDQDWLGRAPLGDARTQPLIDVWQRAQEIAEQHAAGRFTELTLCGSCTEWHRP